MNSFQSFRIAKLLCLLASMCFLSTNLFADVKLRNVSIPASGQFANSQKFAARDTGEIRGLVQVRVKNVMGAVGGSRFQIQLMNGNRAVAAKTLTAGTRYVSASFRYRVKCSNTGSNFYFRVRNVTATIKFAAEARFVSVSAPTVGPVRSRPISAQRVEKRRSAKYVIPANLLISENGGKLEFDLDWRNSCKSRFGCPLKFYLKYKGRNMRDQTSSRSRIKMRYLVPKHMQNRNWTLEIVGPALKQTQTVRGRIKFNPRPLCK